MRAARSLWEAMSRHDWSGAASLLAEDFTSEWPVTLERFCGRERFIAVNRDYPGDWKIDILDVIPWRHGAMSRVRVHLAPDVFEALSFFCVEDGLLTYAVEYWVTWGSEAPPEWRTNYAERMKDLPRAGEGPQGSR